MMTKIKTVNCPTTKITFK